MVTPSLARERVGDLVGSNIRHRRRGVGQPNAPSFASRYRGDVYVKVVAPAATTSLIARHRALGDAGLPVPPVLRSGPGWIAMQHSAEPPCVNA